MKLLKTLWNKKTSQLLEVVESPPKTNRMTSHESLEDAELQLLASDDEFSEEALTTVNDSTVPAPVKPRRPSSVVAHGMNKSDAGSAAGQSRSDHSTVSLPLIQHPSGVYGASVALAVRHPVPHSYSTLPQHYSGMAAVPAPQAAECYTLPTVPSLPMPLHPSVYLPVMPMGATQSPMQPVVGLPAYPTLNSSSPVVDHVRQLSGKSHQSASPSNTSRRHRHRRLSSSSSSPPRSRRRDASLDRLTERRRQSPLRKGHQKTKVDKKDELRRVKKYSAELSTKRELPEHKDKKCSHMYVSSSKMKESVNSKAKEDLGMSERTKS